MLYAIWSDASGHWLGGRLSSTTSEDKTMTIEYCKYMQGKHTYKNHTLRVMEINKSDLATIENLNDLKCRQVYPNVI